MTAFMQPKTFKLFFAHSDDANRRAVIFQSLFQVTAAGQGGESAGAGKFVIARSSRSKTSERGGDCAQAENNIANPAQPFAPHQSETPHPQPPRGSHARHAAQTSLIVLNSCGRASFQTTTLISLRYLPQPPGAVVPSAKKQQMIAGGTYLAKSFIISGHYSGLS